MRAFVALDVGVPGSGPRTAPEHLTVKFLGEVRGDQVPTIRARLATVARELRPFEVRLEGVGAFPSTNRPRVVWIGIAAGREEVVRLASKVRAALAADFPPEPGAFVPHVTWFRVRSADDARAAADVLTGRRPAPEPRNVAVRELLLKESVLRPEGVLHRTVATFPLGNPSHP